MKLFPQKPYFDDYDENKKFYQILSVPGRALQAREVTQLQTILQNQVRSLGDHLFKDGSRVLDGQMSFDCQVNYVKVRLGSNSINLDMLVGTIAEGVTTGAKGQIIAVTPAQGEDPVTLFVKFVSSDVSDNATNWISGEKLKFASTITNAIMYVRSEEDAIGLASIAKVERGVYYIHGRFALVEQQTIILEKYNNVPSCRVGLVVDETIVTSEQDQTLLDNAIGSYNYAAPGANRYKIELTLTKVPLASKVDNENFIELGQIQGGKILKQVVATSYNELEKTLARRTYDESGDYTVRAFKACVREHRSNDRTDWSNHTTYLTGDVVRNNQFSYVALNSGTTTGGTGPNWGAGTGEDNGITWQYVSKPEFNNGVYSADGKVTGLSIIDGGNGYIDVPNVVFESTTGDGAKASAFISEGKVVNVQLDDCGSNYLAGDVTVRFEGGLNNDDTCNCEDGDNSPVRAVAVAYTDSGDSEKIAFGLESGKAYVQGFEIEKVGTTWIDIPKARTFTTVNNAFITPSVGNYFLVTNISGCPTLSSKVNICSAQYGADTPPVIGTCRIKGLEWDSGTVHDSDKGVYRLYVYDIELKSGANLSRDIKSFIYNDLSGKTTPFQCNISPIKTQITGTITFSGSKPTSLTGSGTTFTSELLNGDYLVDNQGNYYRITAVTGQNKLQIENPGLASGVNVTNSIAYLCTTQLHNTQGVSNLYNLPNRFAKTINAIDYVIMSRIDGGQATVTGSNTTVTFTAGEGSEFTNVEENDNYIVFNKRTNTIANIVSATRVDSKTVTFVVSGADSSGNYSLLATLRKSGTTIGRRSKTRETGTKNVTAYDDLNNSSIGLGQVDVYKIASVKMYTGATDNGDGTGSFGSNSAYVDITDRYELDDGQTDSYYGESKIRLKPSYNPPQYPIAIEYVYFRHGAGDYFSVDSYESVEYKDIPSYNGVRLSDVLDFRPDVNIADGSIKATSIKRGTEIEVSYDFYLGRKDKVCLDYQGNFLDVQGVPAVNPQSPAVPALAMCVYDVELLPYTIDVTSNNVIVTQVDNRRYTMRDIGALEKRIARLEEYTVLSLLEQQTESMTIQDSDGLERFKQGFIVDNFKSGSILSTTDDNACCAIDNDNGVCRPTFSQRNIGMIEYVPAGSTTEMQRSSNNYMMYGKLFTLPLDPTNPHVAIVEQPLATRIQNINPFAIVSFYGHITINPSSDDWFETRYLSDIVTRVEGNYLSTKSSLEGTVWNSWQTSWTGQPVVTGTTSSSSSAVTARWTANQYRYTTTTTTTTTNTAYSQQIGQTRSGIKTTVTSTIDYVQVGDRLVSSVNIPYMRSRWLLIRVKSLKPYTRYYPFFDNVNVDYWCVPAARIEYVLNSGTDFDATSAAGGDASSSARKIVATKYSYWPEETDRTCLDIGDVITGQQSRYTAVVVGNTVQPSATNLDTLTKVLYVANIKDANGNGVEGRQYTGDSVSNSSTFTVGESITATGSISGARGTVTYAEPNMNHIHDGLVTNSSGELYFMFWIPDGDKIDYQTSSNQAATFQFRCGDRVFALSDSPDVNNYNAEATYSAVGVLNTREKLINAVRNAVVTKTNVSDNRTITNSWSTTTSSSKDNTTSVYIDPLAQTFITGVKGGCFLSKVDVYFATKPGNENPLPVTLQIRTVENGIPTHKVLPFSTVTLRPDQVNISENSIEYIDESGLKVKAGKYDTPTTFVFESPVYVEDTAEYAVVLLSDSNDYNVWIAQIGQLVPGTMDIVSKQPYEGVLFKSQNASTWTADQTQDLKMTVYRANFDVADSTNNGQTIGNVQFACTEPQRQMLAANAFQVTQGSNLVRVWQPFHGLTDNDVVEITYNNINSVDDDGLLTGTITVANGIVIGAGTRFTYEMSAGGKLYDSQGNYLGTVKEIQNDFNMTLYAEADPANQRDIQYKTDNQTISVGGIEYTELVGIHRVIAADTNSFIIKIGIDPNTQQNQLDALQSGYYGDPNVWYTTVVYNYDVIQPNITYQNFTDTKVSLSISGITGNNRSQNSKVRTGQFGVTENDNNYLTSTLAIWDSANTANAKLGKSLIFNVVFSSSNPALTPIIDGDRVSAILINNLIDDPTENTVNQDIDDVAVVSEDDTSNYNYTLAGSVESVSLSDTNTGLTDVIVEFSGPQTANGEKAEGKVIVNNGRITGVQITKPGYGYTTSPTMTFYNVANGGKTQISTVTNQQVIVKYNQVIAYSAKAKTAFANLMVGKVIDMTDSNGLVVTKTIIDHYINDNLVCLIVNGTFDRTSMVMSGSNAKQWTNMSVRNLYVDEVGPVGGTVYSKYITKPISMANTCNMAKIMFAACTPSGSSIETYFKAYTNSEQKSYNDIPWKKVDPNAPIPKVEVGSTTFTDVEYDAEETGSFDMIAVKVVFRSNNTCAVPMIKDFRVIACL